MLNRRLKYNSNLKNSARHLRKNMTESEQALWSRLRDKQLLGVQFYRQKPLGNFIVDFFAPKGKLVVEVDGSQHAEDYHAVKDKERDNHLSSLGIRVLCFNSREVLKETNAVIEIIFRTIEERLEKKSPQPPFIKGG